MQVTRTWVSAVIFLSAYSPLALVLFIKDIDCKHVSLEHPMAAWLVLALGIVSVAILLLTMKGLDQGLNVTIKKVRLKSSDLVNYTIPYMISFFGFDLSSTKEIMVFALFMVLMCYLTIQTQNVFINPILALMGYGLYEVTYEERSKIRESIFLSRVDLNEGDRFEAQKLTRFLFLVIKNANESKTQETEGI